MYLLLYKIGIVKSNTLFYVARDYDGELHLFVGTMPELVRGKWYNSDDCEYEPINLDMTEFKFIKAKDYMVLKGYLK